MQDGTAMSKRFHGYCDPEALPLRRGETVTIKKGTSIRTSHPTKKHRVAGRTYKVKVDHVLPGMNSPDPRFSKANYPTTPPSVRWAGEGGYWFEVDMNEIPEAMERLPKLAEVERRLGEPASKWAGRCYEIASKIVDAGLVKGVAVFGHFTGEINPESYFGDRHHSPFVQHGWVLLDDGRVLDPTRWAFDGREPYLHVGPLTKDYDEGGNEFRKAVSKPIPDYDPNDRMFDFNQKVLPSGKAWTHIERLLQIEPPQDVGVLTFAQVFWLANAPFEQLEGHAEDIYKAIEAVGESALIPVDNRQMANRMYLRSHAKQASFVDAMVRLK